MAHIDVESVEIGASRATRSTPMNMPLHPNTTAASQRPFVPVLIESGSCSKLICRSKSCNVMMQCGLFFCAVFSGSHEQSPRLMDSFHYESVDSDVVIGPDSQLREDLADAMKDCATIPISRDSGKRQQQVSLISFFCGSVFLSL